MLTKWLDCGYILINFDETVYFGKNILNNYYHSHSCPSPSVGFSLGNPAFTLPVPPPALPKTCPPPPLFFSSKGTIVSITGSSSSGSSSKSTVQLMLHELSKEKGIYFLWYYLFFHVWPLLSIYCYPTLWRAWKITLCD